MNYREKLKMLSTEKKLMLKVIAGVVILAISFFMYIAKHHVPTEEIKITGGDTSLSTTPVLSGEERGQAEDKEEKATEVFIFVDVSGAVRQPSVLSLKEGSRVFEAIELAGGLQEDADTRSINLAQVLNDGEKLYLPTKKEVDTGVIPEVSSSVSVAASSSVGSRININTADAKALQQLSGVGPSTAEKIVDYRNSHGQFKKIEDLQKVSGIGAKTFEKLKDKITV